MHLDYYTFSNQIVELNLANNKILTLEYFEKKSYPNLEKLLIGDNFLSKLKFDKGCFEKLRILNASVNEIRHVEGLKNLPCIKKLDLSKNEIMGIAAYSSDDDYKKASNHYVNLCSDL